MSGENKISRGTCKEFADSRAPSSYLFLFSYTNLHATVENLYGGINLELKSYRLSGHQVLIFSYFFSPIPIYSYFSRQSPIFPIFSEILTKS